MHNIEADNDKAHHVSRGGLIYFLLSSYCFYVVLTSLFLFSFFEHAQFKDSTHTPITSSSKTSHKHTEPGFIFFIPSEYILRTNISLKL